MFIGFVIGFLWENTFVCYVVVGLAVIWMIGLGIVRPYQSNLRPIINSIFVFGVFGIYAYCNFNRDSTDVTFISTYMPVFLIGLLFLAFGFNVVVFGVYHYGRWKEKKEKEIKE